MIYLSNHLFTKLISNIRDSPTIWCLCALFPILLQSYVPFYVKKEKIGNSMCLLELECAKRLKAHSQAIPETCSAIFSSQNIVCSTSDRHHLGSESGMVIWLAGPKFGTDSRFQTCPWPADWIELKFGGWTHCGTLLARVTFGHALPNFHNFPWHHMVSIALPWNEFILWHTLTNLCKKKLWMLIEKKKKNISSNLDQDNRVHFLSCPYDGIYNVCMLLARVLPPCYLWAIHMEPHANSTVKPLIISRTLGGT